MNVEKDQNRVFRRSNEQEKNRHFLRGLAILGQHASGVAGIESSKPRLRGDGVPGFRRLNPGHTAGVLAQDGQATEKMPGFLLFV